MTAEVLVFGALGLTLVVVVATWVIAPLFQGVVPEGRTDDKIVRLLARREAVLASLRDLDADYEDDRLGERDYDRLRSDALAEGAAILGALEELAQGADREIEAAIARIEEEVAGRRGGSSAARACPDCGRVAAAGDTYCARCGVRLVKSR